MGRLYWQETVPHEAERTDLYQGRLGLLGKGCHAHCVLLLVLFFCFCSDFVLVAYGPGVVDTPVYTRRRPGG